MLPRAHVSAWSICAAARQHILGLLAQSGDCTEFFNQTVLGKMIDDEQGNQGVGLPHAREPERAALWIRFDIPNSLERLRITFHLCEGDAIKGSLRVLHDRVEPNIEEQDLF